jgi:arginyl-tRNA--protein-N-Asp/Glu arginylyltransferase
VLILKQWTTAERRCEYLPDREARLEYALAAQMTPDEYEDRMNAGWRKFGHALFHPVCNACTECRPIRIPVAEFTPSRSQRRTLQRNADLQVRVGPPIVDSARLDLYNRYHAAQETRRGWPATEKSAEDYRFSFVQNPIPAREIAVWEGDLLRAVVLTEITPNVVSGVYHYYEPALRERGIGIFAILQTLELARRLSRTYAYFGFYVAGSPSLNYKADFRPCEICDVDGHWHPLPDL